MENQDISEADYKPAAKTHTYTVEFSSGDEQRQVAVTAADPLAAVLFALESVAGHDDVVMKAADDVLEAAHDDQYHGWTTLAVSVSPPHPEDEEDNQ